MVATVMITVKINRYRVKWGINEVLALPSFIKNKKYRRLITSW